MMFIARHAVLVLPRCLVSTCSCRCWLTDGPVCGTVCGSVDRSGGRFVECSVDRYLDRSVERSVTGLWKGLWADRSSRLFIASGENRSESSLVRLFICLCCVVCWLNQRVNGPA